MKTDINEILFIRENNKPCYAYEYALNILKNNPIRECEKEYFMGLKEMKDSTGENIGFFGLNKEIWVYAWDLFFKEKKEDIIGIMVLYGETDFYYINKHKRKHL
jgi:hypothetical protein